MPRRTRRSIERLRRAIDTMPIDTRCAMLEGIGANEIIVGAYTDRDGGLCPMLAAHRCGGRTSLASFARAWDAFTGARGKARRATARELRVLVAHLEASLADPARGELGRAVAEHRELVASRSPRAVDRPAERSGAERPGDPDRRRELRGRAGWAWLRPLRRFDEYERALARLEAQHDQPAPERELV